jgi:nucleotide-binding universal stress UspA family protein
MTSHHGSTQLLESGDTVLLPDARPAHGRPRVVAALGALPADEPVIAEALATARRLAAELVLAHAVPLSFGERSVGLDQALVRGGELLAAAAARVAELGDAVALRTRLVRVRPHELVGERLDADVLLVGGPRAGAPARVGLIARSATRHAPCPVVVVPRSG